MKIYLVTIFPEIFNSFLNTSLIKKSIDKGILVFEYINPRDFCQNKHKQVDDEIYGGGVGLLIKAKPVIDAVNFAIEKLNGTYKILYLSPSKKIFNQKLAHNFVKIDNLILVSGRYEGIDYRFEQYCKMHYSNSFEKISIGKYVLLGGEVASMACIESIVRLVPGVIKEELSRQDESYSTNMGMSNIEYPQYTRPVDVYDMKVPNELLSGDHKLIKNRRENNQIKKKYSKIGQNNKKE